MASNSKTGGSLVSLLRVGVVALPFVHLFSAAFHVYFGALNADEGFYAIAARSVMQGDMPYRDFGYTQMPLLPYINGPFLAIFGYGLFAQRWLNASWALLALLVLARWIGRRTTWTIALAVVASFSLSPAWMHFTHLGKTYAFTGLVAIVAAWVFSAQPGGRNKTWLLGLLGVIGVGCRLPAAPFFAVLWFAALWHDGPLTARRLAHGIVAVVVPALIFLAPIFALSPANMQFWVFDFHALSVPLRHWRTSLSDVAGLAPLWWAGATMVFIVAVIRRAPVSREAVIALAAVAALVPNLVPRGAYVEYAIPFLLPLAGAVACELYRAAKDWSTPGRRALVGGLVAAFLVTIPVLALATGRASSLNSPEAWLPSNVPPYDLDLKARLTRARGLVEQLVPPSAPLLGPNIILAAETGRAVPRNARMGSFAMTAEFSASDAQRLHLLTYPDLQRWLADPKVTLLAFFTTPRANYAWSVPSFKLQPRADAEKWLEILRRDFVIVQQDQHFLLVARPGALPRDTEVIPPR